MGANLPPAAATPTISNEGSWAAAFLTAGGFPVTLSNLRAVVAWEKAEGGHWHNDAKYNPLNTTQPMPGAGNTGTQGNIKVYRSWAQGISASVKTIKNGNYPAVVSALKQGNNGSAVISAIGASPWGTNGSLLSSTYASVGTGTVNAGDKQSGISVGVKVPGLPGISTNDIGNAVEDGAGAAVDAATAVPSFLKQLTVVFQGGFWLRVGKVLLGVAALILGAVMIGKSYGGQIATSAQGMKAIMEL